MDRPPRRPTDPPGSRGLLRRKLKTLDYSGPVTYHRVLGLDLPKDELAYLDDLAFDRTYRGQHDVMYGRHGRLVEARAGSALGGYAFGLPLGHDDDEETEWFIDTVAVAPVLQGRGLGARLVGHLARWLEGEGVQSVTATPLVGPDEDRRERWLCSLGFEEGNYPLVARTRVLAKLNQEGPTQDREIGQPDH